MMGELFESTRFFSVHFSNRSGEVEIEPVHRRTPREDSVMKLNERVEEMKTKRLELEVNRERLIRRIQQLYNQITSRRKEGLTLMETSIHRFLSSSCLFQEETHGNRNIFWKRRKQRC